MTRKIKKVGLMSSQSLSYAVHINEGMPTTNPDVPPGVEVRMWSPTSTTVITTGREALVVDPGFLQLHSQRLVAWLTSEEFPVSKVYVTHGHADHWFGLGAVLDQYPGAVALARDEVIEEMKLQSSPTVRKDLWDLLFPGQLPTTVVLADPLRAESLTLDGSVIKSIPLGHTDGDHTTCLHVPDIGLVVAGDAIYNDVHLMLAASDAEGRASWLRALDTIEALQPTSIVAGHKNPEADDDPRHIEETRQYILEFERAIPKTSSTLDLYEHMLGLYPSRINRGALWGSCRAVKG